MVQATTQDTLRIYGPAQVRRLAAYLLSFTGTVASAMALVMLLQGPVDSRSVAAFIGALLLFWIAWGMLESNPRSWRLFQGVGSALVGGIGAVILIFAIRDLQHWSEISSLAPRVQILCWLLLGGGCIIWFFALLGMQHLASLALQFALLPACLVAGWAWLHVAMTGQHFLAVLISLVWAVVCILLFLAFVRPDLHAFISSLKQGNKRADEVEHFPTRYHEMLSRGHYCDIFELPCTSRCPLSTTVASRYQQMRQKHHDSEQIMDALEKAYTVLITPQKRELCAIAHEIMDDKKKQLGTRRFEALERLLWTKIWKRLQDNEIKGDPVKARSERQRLMREL